MHGTRALTALAVLLIYSHAWADNTVTRWVEQALDTVRAQNIGTGPAARVYAMTTVAMYDAVNGIDRARHLSTREQAIVPPTSAAARRPSSGRRRGCRACGLKSFVLRGLGTGRRAGWGTGEGAARPATPAHVLRERRADLGGPGRAWRSSRPAPPTAPKSAETQPAGTGIGEYRRAVHGRTVPTHGPLRRREHRAVCRAHPPALASDRYSRLVHRGEGRGRCRPIRTRPAPRLPDTGRQKPTRPARPASGSRRRSPSSNAGVRTISLSHTARLFALLGMGVADAVATAWNGKFDAHSGVPVMPSAKPAWMTTPTPCRSRVDPAQHHVRGLAGVPVGHVDLRGRCFDGAGGLLLHRSASVCVRGEQGTRRDDYRRFSQAADEAGRLADLQRYPLPVQQGRRPRRRPWGRVERS